MRGSVNALFENNDELYINLLMHPFLHFLVECFVHIVYAVVTLLILCWTVWD